MHEKKFDPRKLEKLNNPQRLNDIPPKTIWEKLNVRQPDVLVEIGAGTAFFSIAFLKQSKASKLYACDTSEIMLEWIRENVVPEYPDIIPLKTGEHSIPLDDDTADVVFMINLHHELDDPALTLNEAYRILKGAGKIFIVDWKKEDMAEGPPAGIRFEPGLVEKQLVGRGFENVAIFNELPKHFLLIGEKGVR